MNCLPGTPGHQVQEPGPPTPASLCPSGRFPELLLSPLSNPEGWSAQAPVACDLNANENPTQELLAFGASRKRD